MRGFARSLAAVVPASALVAGSILMGPAALADEAKAIQVSSTEGRNVTFTVYLGPDVAPNPDAEVSSKVVIAGTEVPSEAQSVVATTAPKEAVLVLDISGSMRGPRLAAAKQAAQTYVASLPADVEVGLVSFNDTATVQVQPTTDKQAVIDGIKALEAGRKTALYDGAMTGFDLADPNKGARLLILSDGGDTASTVAVEDVVKRANADRIPVDVVSISPSAEHATLLESLANPSGGQFIRAEGAAGLDKAFQEASGSFGAKVKITAELPASVNGNGTFAIVSVNVDGTDFKGTTQMPKDRGLAATEAGSAPTVTTTAPAAQTPVAGLTWQTLISALLAAVIIMALAFAFWSYQRSRKARLRREQVLWYSHAQQTGDVGRRPDLEREGMLQGLDGWMSQRSWYTKVDTRIDNANLSFSVATWVVLRTLVTVILALAMALFLPNIVVGLVFGAALGWIITGLWINSRQSDRRKKFEEELPDFMLLIASALRSGLSFQQGLDSAAQEGTGEVSRQIRRALNEAQMGSSIEAALTRVADRMHNEDLRWAVVALTIQREVGGNLSNILEAVAQTIKAREDLRREVRTLSAEGRLSGWVLAGLPTMLFLYLYMTNRDYVSFFWTTPVGIASLIGMLVLFVLGLIWVRRVVRIEV